MIANDFVRRNGGLQLSEKTLGHISVLGLSRISRCFGIFLLNDLLRYVHVVQLLFLVKLGAAAILCAFQKPFSQGRNLGKTQWTKIVQFSFLQSTVEVLWFYGITFCGPLRSILMFEHNGFIVLAFLNALFRQTGGSTKFRGAVLFLLGFLCCVIFDRDVSMQQLHSETHSHHTGLNHLFYHLINWIGLSDHKSGVFLLMIALLLSACVDYYGRKVGVEVGGTKRLNALASLVSSILLAPWAFWASISQGTMIDSFGTFIPRCVLVVLTVFVIDYYVSTLTASRLDSITIARMSCVFSLVSSVVIYCIWFGFPSFSGHNGHDELPTWPNDQIHQPVVLTKDHGLTGGVIITMILFVIATFTLTASESPKATAGQFIGYSATGLPLYVYGDDFLQRTSHSITLFVKNTLKQILSSRDSRRIFYFLCANLMFTFVEFTYGIWTNSLGLISDAFHMLFDCSALVMGLVAAVMAKWKPTRVFSYGYGRVETLSGFINALFLVTIAFFIFLEAIERLMDPPEVHTERLFTVSVLGLCVNLFGMFVFHDAHGHSHGGGGGGHEHSHDKDHGHSHSKHGGDLPTHSHSHSHGHSHGGGNANMQGVFLHVLADTLGSVAVIISSLLIYYFGWNWTDPFCSLLLACLIIASVIPLLRGSAQMLSQCSPGEIEHEFEEALDKILHLPGVISYSNAHIWQLNSEKYVATLNIQCSNETQQQKLCQQILHVLKSSGIKEAGIQIEKDSYFQYINLIHPSLAIPERVMRRSVQDTLMASAI